MIPSSFVEQVQTRIRVSEVIARRLNVQRKGREFVAICPFHNDTKPSLTINDEKGFYHCFACGAHGTAIDFLKNYEGLSFVEAVERLAGHLGMQVPKASPMEAKKAAQKKDLYDVMDHVCRYFQQQLYSLPGQEALQILHKRGLSDDTIKAFRLGFAPSASGHFMQAMDKQGISQQQLIDTGMLITVDEGDREPYPRFRGRIMFPIFDIHGRCIAFGGRIIGEGEPKYLNSPETILFHKGHVLFAYHQASVSVRKTGQFFVGEGYMDVIAMHQAGFDGAVAPLGTAITESQLALLWRNCREPILCFDGDVAGQKAAMRACQRALPMLKPSYGLRFAMMPKNEDPDSVIQKQGAETLKQIFAQSLSVSEYLWQHITQLHQNNTPEENARIDGEIIAICQQIKDPIIREHMTNFLRGRFWKKLGFSMPSVVEPAKIANRFDQKTQQYGKKANKTIINDNETKKYSIDRKKQQEQILLLTIIAHPKLITYVEDRLISAKFQHHMHEQLRQEILDILSDYVIDEYEELAKELNARGQQTVLQSLRIAFDQNFGRIYTFINPASSLQEVKRGWDEIWENWWVKSMEQQEASVLKKSVTQDETNLTRIAHKKKMALQRKRNLLDK